MAKIKDYLLLYIGFFIYSLSSIFSKLASGHDFYSLSYISMMGMVLICLITYAIIWQEILSRFELNIAMSNKPITIVFGLLMSLIFFKEVITFNNVVGIIFILIGVLGVTRNG